jgi:hypothetical protein
MNKVLVVLEKEAKKIQGFKEYLEHYLPPLDDNPTQRYWCRFCDCEVPEIEYNKYVW